MTETDGRFAGLPIEKRSIANRYFEALDERNQAAFQVLTRMDVGDELAECSTYNYQTLLAALEVDPGRLLGASGLDYSKQLRMRLIATFSNFSAGACAVRDYIGVWSQEHRNLAGMNAALMGLKNDGAFKVVKRIRNRMMHGAIVFSGIKVAVHTRHSTRAAGHWMYLAPTEATLLDIKDESPSRGGRVGDEFRAGDDWMHPLIGEVQSALASAWATARGSFMTGFGALDARRTALAAELDSLATQLLPWTPAIDTTVTDGSGTRSLGRGAVQATPGKLE